MVNEILSRISEGKNVVLPKHKTLYLNDITKLHYLKKDVLPITCIEIQFNVSRKFEKDNEIGILNYLTDLFEMGCGKYNKYDFEDQLSYYGITYNISSSKEKITLSFVVPSEFIDKALELIKININEPHFNEDDLSHLLDHSRQIFNHLTIEPSFLSDSLVNRIMFKYHPTYKHIRWGYTETLNNITRERILYYYENYFMKANAEIFCVTDLDEDIIINKLKNLNFTTSKFENPKVDFDKNIQNKKLYLVDRNEALQAKIVLANYAERVNSQNHFTREIMNQVLIGDFNSLLNSKIREQVGATYGVRSYFVDNDDLSLFQIETDVENDKLNTVFKIFYEEFDYLKNQLDDNILEDRKYSQYNGIIKYYEMYQLANVVISSIVEYNLEDAYYKNFKENIFNVNSKMVMEMAQKHLNDNMVIFVVGKADIVKEQLAGFNFDIVEINNEDLFKKDLVA